MSRPVLVVKLIKASFPLKSVGARLTRVPVLGKVVERLLFEGDDILFMPRRIPVGEGIEEQVSEVAPHQVIERFIEEAGFLWIMNTCICRESMKCKDYPSELGCLFMGEAARGINPRLGRQVSREEALEHVDRCRQAGLFHLVGRNRVDAVWLNIKPGDRLLTVCNCCTCCCLWTMLPQLNEAIASRVGRMPGVEVRVTEKCAGCGTCLSANCMADAISVVDGRAVIDAGCLGCGRCVEICPENAIELTFEGPEAVARAVRRLSALVDVT
jgi:ferredoxin